MKIYEDIYEASVSHSKAETCSILSYRPMHSAETNVIMGIGSQNGVCKSFRGDPGHMEPMS